jgi:capsular exopolysaccharide synthesis family protein
MERIKQALERARVERGESFRSTSRPPRPNGPDEAPISYNETRVFQPPPEVLRRNRVMMGNEHPGAVAAYKLLRTQVLQRMKEKNWNALAVTSPGPDEGKTLTSVNLAISLAREVNHTVLLVDLDLRNPSVARVFGYTPEIGVLDIVQWGARVSDALVNPGVERLVVLPGREAVVNSSEILSSPRMVDLVQDLKSRYPTRFVVFDLPPLLSADDALAFSPHVDAALLVASEGKTRREELAHAAEYLRATPLLGTVLNRSREAVGSYYYY